MSIESAVTSVVQIQELVAIRHRLVTVEDPKTLYVTMDGATMTARQRIILDAIQDQHPEARWGMKDEKLLAQTDEGIFVVSAKGNYSMVTQDGIVLHLREEGE